MKLLLILCFAVIRFLVVAQTEVQQGVQYESGTHLKVSSLGLKFKLPTGFTGGVPQGSTVMVIADASSAITILLTAEQMQESSILADLQQVIPIDGGVTISPRSVIKRDGKRWFGDYAVNGVSQEMKGYVEVRLGDHQIGVGCILVALPDAFDRGKRAATELLQSMVFMEPAGVDGIDQSWNEYLKHKSLKFYHTQGDYSDSDFIYLCSNGSYSRQRRTSSGGGVGLGTMNSTDYGQWEAVGKGMLGKLILISQDGSRSEFDISYTTGNKGKGIYLNGNRYYEETTSECN